MSEAEEERFARPRVAAGVLFRDEAGRILLVKPTYKEGWDIPGGYVEHGESPRSAAVRELREELRVSWPVGHLLVVDWAPYPSDGDKLLFIFDGGIISRSELATVHLEPDELAELAFCGQEALMDLMPARLARRVSAAINATRGSYLEHGR